MYYMYYYTVTVELDHSIASQTALAKQHQGCTIDSKFYAEGTQVSDAFLHVNLCMQFKSLYMYEY